MVLICVGIALHFPLSTFHSALAQVGNLGQFDSRTLHYGIQVGLTESKFDLRFSEDDELRQAQELFDALRAVDEIDGVKTVYAHCPSAEGVGMALYNRLIRAAAFEVIDLPKKRIMHPYISLHF